MHSRDGEELFAGAQIWVIRLLLTEGVKAIWKNTVEFSCQFSVESLIWSTHKKEGKKND